MCKFKIGDRVRLVDILDSPFPRRGSLATVIDLVRAETSVFQFDGGAIHSFLNSRFELAETPPVVKTDAELAEEWRTKVKEAYALRLGLENRGFRLWNEDGTVPITPLPQVVDYSKKLFKKVITTNVEV